MDVTAARAPKLEKEMTRDAENRVVMAVTVTDYYPDPTGYVWTIPNEDGTTFTLKAGESNDKYTASEVIDNDGSYLVTLTTTDTEFDRNVEMMVSCETLWTQSVMFEIPGVPGERSLSHLFYFPCFQENSLY